MSTDRPVALITGGAKRVGAATATALAASGFDLIITVRTSRDEAEQLAQQLNRDHDATTDIRTLDLDDLDATDALSRTLAAELPRLDALIHNASIYKPTPLNETDAQTALHFARVNAIAPLLLTKHLAPKLAASPRPGGGAVVAMTDMHVYGRPRDGFTAYAMSKAAIAEMVHSLAIELAPDIRVNAVAPGVVAFPDEGYESDDNAQTAYIDRVPLDCAGTPQHAAEAVRWLICNATYCSGETIRIDGGRWLA